MQNRINWYDRWALTPFDLGNGFGKYTPDGPIIHAQKLV